MPRLADNQCYQVVKAGVDVAPIVALLDRLPFMGINYHIPAGSDPNRPACDVVLADKFPPDLLAFIGQLDLGGTTGRMVIRRLNPGQNIPLHTDAWMPGELNWRRFQIPLVSAPDVRMRWPNDGADVHLEPGNVYEVRYDRPHEVVNPSATRIHLQIDQIDATI
jgi:hypothetical protein